GARELLMTHITSMTRTEHKNIQNQGRKGRARGPPWRAQRGGVWGAMSGPPTSKDLTLERDGRVAVVTIDRASDQNRLTREVMLGLEDIVRGLAGDDETQTVVLTGAGSEFFSMGILSPVVRASY